MNNSSVRTFCTLLTILLIPEIQAMDSEEIHAKINNAVSRGTVGAAVVGIYDQGDVRVSGYGQKNPGEAQKPDGETLFEIGSITKVFTAILVQRLVEQDRLEWDDPVSSYLNDFQFENESVGAITLRSLATHSSGLPRLPANISPADSLNPYADYGQSDLHAFLRSFNPDSLSREYAYSNLGVGLLGSIAADVAEMEYPIAITDYIFEPLGMSRSFASYPQQTDSNMALGYSNGAVVPAWTFEVLAGAGAIVSTANDLMQLIRANCEDDASDMHKAIAATQQPQEVDAMALGWNTRSDSGGNTVYWHNGGTGGYAGFLAVNPMKSQGWLILAASTEYAWVTELGLSLLAPSERVEQVDLSPYTGVFQLAPTFFLTFSERDGRLFGQATGQAEFPLTHEGKHEFQFSNAQIQVTFQTPSDGVSSEIEFVQAGQTINAPRVEDKYGSTAREEIHVDSEDLKAYEGQYQLAEGVAMTVTVRGSRLFIQVTGQAAFPAFAMDTDRFFLKVVDAEIEFLRDDSGAVHELILHQAGEHRATRIEAEPKD